MRFSPPLTEESRPLATLLRPPLTEEALPLASLRPPLFQSRRERLHLRFELGDASPQALRGSGRGGSGEHGGSEENDPDEERAAALHG